jgi:hypothetical protein
MRNSAQKSDSSDAHVVFPSGAPKRHVARQWGRDMDARLTSIGKTCVARNKLPPGMFRKPWSKEALELPPAPSAKASYKDLLSYRQWTDEIERRMNDNAQLAEQKEQWWLENNNKYFTELTEGMRRTNPGLRDLLRERHHVQDGYFNGVGALESIDRWLKEMHRRFPDFAFYESAMNVLESKRLHAGSPARSPPTSTPS